MKQDDTIDSDIEPSLAIARRALRQIASYGISAHPKNFEVWYLHESSSASPVRDALKARLTCNGTLTDSDCDDVYDGVVARDRPDGRLIELGGTLAQSLNAVHRDISSVELASTEFQGRVSAAASELRSTGGATELASILKTIRAATADAMRRNQELLLRLDTAKGQIGEIKGDVARIRKESLTDALTQVSNRKAFDAAIRQLMQDCRQKSEPLALLLLDVDHFKKFNDSHGHLAGDQVLRLVGHQLTQQIKGQDFAARYGGEEFAVILPRTSEGQAIAVAEKFRRSISSNHLRNRKTGAVLGKVTISIGVAAMDQSADADQLVERADRCLYAAKSLGRNRVICESDLEESGEVSQVASSAR